MLLLIVWFCGYNSALRNPAATISNACNLAVSADVISLLGLYVDISNVLVTSVPTEAFSNLMVTSQDGCNLTVTTSTPRNFKVASIRCQ